MSFVKIKSWLTAMVTVATVALVGCGGGGGSGTPFVGPVTGSVAAIQVTFASGSVGNTVNATNIATVTAVDGNGRGVSGVAINLGVDNNATYTTNSSGAIATDQLAR